MLSVKFRIWYRNKILWDKDKLNLSLYKPWNPLGLLDVDAPTLSYIWLTDVAGRPLPPG
jgi:hypothetical protein